MFGDGDAGGFWRRVPCRRGEFCCIRLPEPPSWLLQDLVNLFPRRFVRIRVRVLINSYLHFSLDCFRPSTLGSRIKNVATSMDHYFVFCFRLWCISRHGSHRNVAEITTAMVTSAYVQLLVDPDLFQMHNRLRSKRSLFVCSPILSNFIGATAYKFVRPASSLLLYGMCKTAISVTFIFSQLASNHELECDITEEGPPG